MADRTPFEIIRATQKSPDKLRVPQWWDKQKKTPKPTGGGSWWLRPIAFEFNRAFAIGAGVVAIALIVIAYEIGASAAQEAVNQTDNRSTRLLADLRAQAVNHELLAGQSSTDRAAGYPGAGSRHIGPDRALGDGQTTATENSAAGAGGGDPRIAGLNYYCLATMPQRYRSQGEQMVAFLARNQVDAMVVSVHNHKIQVVALRGFERISSREAQRFRERLRALGIAWKAEHNGYTDWHDMYAIKHRPDR